MEKFPPIPDDHPIQQIRDDNQNDPLWLIGLAWSGDKDAVKRLIRRYLNYREIEKNDQRRGFKPLQENRNKLLVNAFIEDCLKRTLETDDANEGFILSNDIKNRPRATHKDLRRQYDIAVRVAELIDEFPSKNKAYEMAAREFHISKETARSYYDKFIGSL